MNNSNTENINIYDDDIDFYLQEYCNRYGFDEYKLTYRQWSGALRYIYNNTFKKDNSMLFDSDISNKQYNLDVINKLVDRYLYICDIHNQEISILGFEKLSGISDTIIYQWNNDTYRTYDYYLLDGTKISKQKARYLNDGEYYKKASNKAKYIYKKLSKEHFDSVRNGAGSVGVGPLALFNDMVAKESAQAAGPGQLPDYSKSDVIDRLGIANELQGLPDLQAEK